jgi:hypothetical protein
MGKKEYMMVKEGLCDGLTLPLLVKFANHHLIEGRSLTEPPFVLAERVVTERCLALFF